MPTYTSNTTLQISDQRPLKGPNEFCDFSKHINNQFFEPSNLQLFLTNRFREQSLPYNKRSYKRFYCKFYHRGYINNSEFSQNYDVITLLKTRLTSISKFSFTLFRLNSENFENFIFKSKLSCLEEKS